jgi:hypothetical protein
MSLASAANVAMSDALLPDSPLPGRRHEIRALAERKVSLGLRSQPLVWLFLASSSGIIVDRAMGGSTGGWWLAGVASLVGWWFCVRFHAPRCALMALLASWFAIGAGWHHLAWHEYDPAELGLRATDDSQPVCLEALARSSPERLPSRGRDPLDPLPRGDRTRLSLQVVRVRDGQSWQSATGYTTLTVDGHLLGIAAGDRLRIVAQLSRVAEPLNPGQFDSQRHWRADRKLCRLWADNPACVVRIERGSPWNLARAVDRVRASGEQMLAERLAPSRATLASVLLLGSRKQLDDERTEGYFVTGLIHVL